MYLICHSKDIYLNFRIEQYLYKYCFVYIYKIKYKITCAEDLHCSACLPRWQNGYAAACRAAYGGSIYLKYENPSLGLFFYFIWLFYIFIKFLYASEYVFGSCIFKFCCRIKSICYCAYVYACIFAAYHIIKGIPYK